MKILVMVFGLFLICSFISSASAHPTPIKATILDDEGLILFNVETNGGYGTNISNVMPKIYEKNILQSNNLSDTNFIWILTSVIIMIMMPIALTAYKDDIFSTIKLDNQ